MNRCPLTYEPCDGSYSPQGLRLLSRRLTALEPFPYSAEEQLREAAARAAKMSIQGVQPKLSARLNVRKRVFEVVDSGGTYIVKPQTPQYAELPENEDLTMRLASAAGIAVPLHGLIYGRDGRFSYVVRRFDREGRGGKVPLEDFAQLSGKDRETKYRASMEQVAQIVERFCTFPAVEKGRLFRLTCFNYLAGNEDAHLKNFSLIRQGDQVALSPAYDLINTTLAVNATEELALPLNGRKSRLGYDDFVGYFAQDRLRLPGKVVQRTWAELAGAMPRWDDLIGRSFLSDPMKQRYRELLQKRAAVLRIG